MKAVRSPLFEFLVLSLVIFAVLYGLLTPPFIGFDTYHYLELSLVPVAGDNHPVGFGYVLFLLALLARDRFDIVFLAYQSACLAGSILLLVASRRVTRSVVSPAGIRTARAAVVLLTPFVVLGNLFLADAYASEVTSILQVVAIAILARWLVDRWSWAVAGTTGLMMLVAYHTRYMLIIAPLALVVVSLRPSGPSRSRIRIGILALTSLFAIVLSDWLFATVAIRHGDLKRSEASRGVQISMLCALRCDSDLFSLRCDSPENRVSVENPSCTEFFHQLKPTGRPRVAFEEGLTAFLLRAKTGQLAKWLLLAPLVYLVDIHQIELGPVDFRSMTRAIAYFPEAFDHYDRVFAYSHGAVYSPTFRVLADVVDRLYVLRAYHVLTGVVVVMCCWIVMRVGDAASCFLAAYAVGTYLLFAYVNPSAPLRYLLQVLTPGYCSLLLIILGRPAIERTIRS